MLWLLASARRLKIAACLAQRELPVGELVSCTGLGQATVSQHLAVLREAGAVSVTRRDRQRFYRLTDARLLSLIEWIEKSGWRGGAG